MPFLFFEFIIKIFLKWTEPVWFKVYTILAAARKTKNKTNKKGKYYDSKRKTLIFKSLFLRISR